MVCVDRTVDEWEALHQGTDREGFDSPNRYDLTGITHVTQLARRVRQAAPPAPPAPPRFAHHSLVRPYARTGGRTRPRRDLALEALVVTTPAGQYYHGVSSPEERFICDLCVEVHSVAEIAAYARLPLGVVKVIVDDLARVGSVEIQQPGFVLTDRSSHDFMTRILDGLKAL